MTLANTARLFTLAAAATLSQTHAIGGTLPVGSIESIGVLPGGNYSFAYRISGDGRRVAGHSQGASGQQRAVYYESGALTEIGAPPGQARGNAFSISNNGEWFTGTSNSLGWRWSQSTGFTTLGTFEPRGISNDGSQIIGGGGRWTQATGWQSITGLPNPQAITPDASTIVGGSGLGAVRWTAPFGAQVISPGGNDQALDVSPNGSTVVGRRSVASAFRAFKWTESVGLIDLGTLPNQRVGLATGTSADGSVIVGNATVTGATGQAFPQPWIWTQQTGMLSLRSFLQQQGISLAGWALYETWDISDDGRTISGYGVNTDSQFVGWVAHVPSLPAPGTAAMIGAAGLLAIRRRRRGGTHLTRSARATDPRL